MIDMWRLNLNYNIPHNSTLLLHSTAQWERPDKTNDAFGQLGTGMSANVEHTLMEYGHFHLQVFIWLRVVLKFLVVLLMALKYL